MENAWEPTRCAACHDRRMPVEPPSPRRRSVLGAVAALVPAGGARVAVDGVDGAGKTVFADELADVLRAAGRPVVRVSVDDFHHVRAVRYRRGRTSPEGFFLDSYDYARFRADVLDPFAPGGDRRHRTRAHDLATDALLDPPWERAPDDAVLLVDGIFLHRDELAAAWDVSVFLDVPFAVTAARMAARDGSHPDPEHPSTARYVLAQRRYLRTCRPRERATVVVDNTDPAAPYLAAR